MPRPPKFTPVAASALCPSPENLFVGTSGWAYSTWKPGFYPADVPTRAFLHHYAANLTSVEVNYTFRTLPTAPQLEGWLASTPPGFRFSFKAPQRITHFQRLRESEAALTEFLASLAPARKARKLGAVLFQLPPNFKLDLDRLRGFLALPAFRQRWLQPAFEFRDESWFCDPVYAVLRQRKAALCIAESDDLVTPDVTTAPHLYYRLRCNGGYSSAKVQAFASRFTSLAATHEVFAYFKHEDEPTGVLNAAACLKRAARLSAKSLPGKPKANA